MPYEPSFTEVFLAYLVVLFWSGWLGRHGQAPALMQLGPLAIGLLLLVGQAVATYSLMYATAGIEVPGWIEVARWGSVALVGVGLAVDAAFTVRYFARPGSPPAPPAAG